MLSRKRLTQWAAVAIVGLCTAAESRASIILTLDPGSPTPVSGGFSYSYTATLSSDQQVHTGDYFAIIDFAGYVSGSVFSSNSDFSAAVEMTTTPPAFQQFDDDPNIENLVFTYTGAGTVGGGIELDLGQFGATSTLGPDGLLVQTAEAHKFNANTGNYDLVQGNSTFVVGPGDGSGGIVPVPPSIVLLLTGTLGLAGFSRLRRRSVAVA